MFIIVSLRVYYPVSSQLLSFFVSGFMHTLYLLIFIYMYECLYARAYAYMLGVRERAGVYM